MIKELTIKVKSKIDLFKGYIAAVNWTLGTNSLTEAEIEILSVLMYYNDVYKEISDNQIRSDLILSNVVKKKIKDEFGVSSAKLETYLGKLRKKGIITSSLSPRFMIYPSSLISVKFNFTLSTPVSEPLTELPQVSEPVYEPVNEPEYIPTATDEPSEYTSEWTPNYED
jgi:hypothetical protein